MEKVGIVDLTNFLKGDSCEDLCKEVFRSFKETGILIVKDPRVSEEENENFLDMMEKYYNQSDKEKEKDSRPEYAYQVGSTPEGTEKPRDNSEVINKLNKDNQPHIPKAADHKWRFFWRAGELPKETKYKSLNAKQVIPEKFPQWENVMNGWSSKMLSAVKTVCEMFALSNGWKKDRITSLMNYAPHLLAPTGSDMKKYGVEGSIMAGFHYDLNFITIHGKSRYPGLYVWLRNGAKFLVKVPTGHLLLQAGKQFEYLTGGEILAGYHEVVVVKETLEKIQKVKEQGDDKILWRVSSTLFSHIASDNKIGPIEQFATEEAKKKYENIDAGEQVQKELKEIKLGIKSDF
eukprot:gene10377-2906_t